MGAIYIPSTPEDVGAAPAAAGVPSGGSQGQVLAKKTASAYDTEWVTPDGGGGGGGIAPSIIDAKGDLIAGTADDTPGRLAVGANGYKLRADSSATTGLMWVPDEPAPFAAGTKYLYPMGIVAGYAGTAYAFSTNTANSQNIIVEVPFDAQQAGKIESVSVFCTITNDGEDAAINFAAYAITGAFTRSLIASLGSATIGTDGVKTVSFEPIAVPRFFVIHARFSGLNTSGNNPKFCGRNGIDILAADGPWISQGNNGPVAVGYSVLNKGSFDASATVERNVNGEHLLVQVKAVAS